jgi:hypothetical protein
MIIIVIMVTIKVYIIIIITIIIILLLLRTHKHLCISSQLMLHSLSISPRRPQNLSNTHNALSHQNFLNKHLRVEPCEDMNGLTTESVFYHGLHCSTHYDAKSVTHFFYDEAVDEGPDHKLHRCGPRFLPTQLPPSILFIKLYDIFKHLIGDLRENSHGYG